MDEQNGNGRGNGAGAIIACSIAGLCVGAAIGMLFAPKPGREIRAELAEKVKSLKLPSKS